MELALLFAFGFAKKMREGIVQIDQSLLWRAFADLIHIGEFGGFQGVQFFMELLCIGHGQASGTSFLLASQPPVKCFSRTAAMLVMMLTKSLTSSSVVSLGNTDSMQRPCTCMSVVR